MTLGKTPVQTDLFRSTTEFCEPRVKSDSIYALLHRECFRLFPDEPYAVPATFSGCVGMVGARGVEPPISCVVSSSDRSQGPDTTAC
jgi:hypothetical protein